jgi:imidazolonepropionase
MLRAARALARARNVTVKTSFFGAHALPPEAGGDKNAYIRQLCEDMLPALAAEGLVDAVDALCEEITFGAAQTARVFAAARALGLPVKLHADQLENGGGAQLAAHWGALSADHLEHADDGGAAAMAASGTVAVLLPCAFYTLRERPAPPVATLRRHGTHIAIATDCNPGTSPVTSLLLTMNMAATLFGLTVAECVAGVTREAARALGCLHETGTLEPGKWCDLAIWDIATPSELVFRLGFNPLHARVWHGR